VIFCREVAGSRSRACVEYEALCVRDEHLAAAGLRVDQAVVFLDAVTALVHPVESHFVWRPQLRDPADEMVLEAAVNGQADTIVTFHRRDFGSAPDRFGLRLQLPRDALRRVAP
jgi:PIN domain